MEIRGCLLYRSKGVKVRPVNMDELKERVIKNWKRGCRKKSLINDVYYSKRGGPTPDKDYDRKMAQRFVEETLLEYYLKNILKREVKING